MTGRGKRGALLFVNPNSARGRKWRFDAVDFRDKYDVELAGVHFDLEPEHIAEVLRSAESQGIETVLVAGGDGTQGTIAACLAHRPFTMGVLPAGTANDFARSLKIPMSLEGAMRVISEGRATRVDLGQAGERIFCHVATVGINTDFARAAQRIRPYLQRASYPVAAALMFHRRKTFRAKTDDGTRTQEHEAIEVAVVNAPVYGGPLDLKVRGLDLEDRKLRMLIVTDVRLSTVLRALPSLLRRHPLAFSAAISQPVTQIHLSTEPPLPLALDGEISGCTPVDIRVLPAALRVFVPRSFERNTGGLAV